MAENAPASDGGQGGSGPFGTATAGQQGGEGAGKAPAGASGPGKGAPPASGMPGFGAQPQGGGGDPGDGSVGPVVPASADEYEFALAADFEAPEGLQIEFDADNPVAAEFRSIAHEVGLSQDQFSRIATLYAKSIAAEHQHMQAASKEQFASLGPNASARVDAVTRFLTAHLGEEHAKPLIGVLFTKPQVEAFEKLMGQFKSRGIPAPSGAGRETGGRDKGWGTNTPTLRKFAAALGYGKGK